MMAPVHNAKPKPSRNLRNSSGKATSCNKSSIVVAQNGNITTGNNSPINQKNIFIQLFLSKETIGGAIIIIVLKIIYYFWKK